MGSFSFTGLAAGVALALSVSLAAAKEYPIGKPKVQAGMEIAAVYLQPIEMEPAGMMRAAKDSDIHLEADIKATKANKNGFADGDWVPHLYITYELTKDGGQPIKGEAMPMVASDGPHYGDNVKLDGPGKYKLRFTVAPPNTNEHGTHFGRHTDKETGVGEWFKPFTVEYEFTFAGFGKKGSY